MNDKREPQPNIFPPGWDEERFRTVLEHFESQPEVEAVQQYNSALKEENPPA